MHISVLRARAYINCACIMLVLLCIKHIYGVVQTYLKEQYIVDIGKLLACTTYYKAQNTGICRAMESALSRACTLNKKVMLSPQDNRRKGGRTTRVRSQKTDVWQAIVSDVIWFCAPSVRPGLAELPLLISSRWFYVSCFYVVPRPSIFFYKNAFVFVFVNPARLPAKVSFLFCTCIFSYGRQNRRTNAHAQMPGGGGCDPLCSHRRQFVSGVFFTSAFLLLLVLACMAPGIFTQINHVPCGCRVTVRSLNGSLTYDIQKYKLNGGIQVFRDRPVIYFYLLFFIFFFIFFTKS